MKDDLKLRSKIKSKKPNFLRQCTFKKKRLLNKPRWRKPKGIDSKLRLRFDGRKMVTPGYGSPATVKGLTREGLIQKTVFNLEDLKDVDSKTTGILISGSVGLRKKIAIVETAVKQKITILNVKDVNTFLKDTKEMLSAKKKEKVAKKTDKPSKKEKAKKESIEDKLSDEDKKKLEKKEIDRLLTKKF